MEHSTDSFTKNIEAIVMGVLMFFVSFTFGNIANAEEVAPSDGVNQNRAALMEKLTELKEMRARLQALRGENLDMAKDVAKETYEAHKEERRQSLEEFKASIADLSPEEKKTAMIAFVAELRAQAEALKAQREAARAERQEARVEDREAFQASLEGMTPRERLDALRARLEVLLGRASDTNEQLSEATDDSEDDASEEQASAEDDTFDDTDVDLSCVVETDADSYVLGDVITVTWSSEHANYLVFVEDTSGKDNQTVPGDKLGASGTTELTSDVLGNPSITMEAVDENGNTEQCSVTFSVAEETS